MEPVIPNIFAQKYSKTYTHVHVYDSRVVKYIIANCIHIQSIISCIIIDKKTFHCLFTLMVQKYALFRAMKFKTHRICTLDACLVRPSSVNENYNKNQSSVLIS